MGWLPLKIKNFFPFPEIEKQPWSLCPLILLPTTLFSDGVDSKVFRLGVGRTRVRIPTEVTFLSFKNIKIDFVVHQAFYLMDAEIIV
jgi:hypothetical protein